jgi:hypothetical protein
MLIVAGGHPYKPKNQRELPSLCKIEMLHFDFHWRTWFMEHEFPNIDSLSITCSLTCNKPKVAEPMDDFEKYNKHLSAQNLSAIFSGMKTLKHLTLRCEVPYDLVKAEFQLETAEAYCILPFIESSAPTLKSLKFFLLEGFKGFELKFDDFLDLYSDYPQLESLSAVFYFSKGDLNKQLPSSETIKHLHIHIEDKKNDER